MYGFYIYTHLFFVMDLYDSVSMTVNDLHLAFMTTFV